MSDIISGFFKSILMYDYTRYIMYVVIAYMLDLVVGDPVWLPHPVRFIGLLVTKTEGFLRKWTGVGNKNKEKIAGFILAIFVVASTGALVFAVLQTSLMIHIFLYHIVSIYIIYSALATKCLSDEAQKVLFSLQKNDLPESRKRLSYLVGRQTENLTEGEVVRATVETVAENTVDGIISPLFYLILGGPVLGPILGYIYKASNTLDSMVGYMNEKYMNFGFASAKLDDLLNFIPARISGFLIAIAAFFVRLDAKGSIKIMLRDHKNHKSPNCGYPEAAFAGALGIKIGGTNVYFGQTIYKPTIGDPKNELSSEHIMHTIILMYTVSFVAIVLFLSALYLVFWLID